LANLDVSNRTGPLESIAGHDNTELAALCMFDILRQSLSLSFKPVPFHQRHSELAISGQT